VCGGQGRGGEVSGKENGAFQVLRSGKRIDRSDYAELTAIRKGKRRWNKFNEKKKGGLFHYPESPWTLFGGGMEYGKRPQNKHRQIEERGVTRGKA